MSIKQESAKALWMYKKIRKKQKIWKFRETRKKQIAWKFRKNRKKQITWKFRTIGKPRTSMPERSLSGCSLLPKRGERLPWI
nr:hypothetical protein [uncultured Schaedlerella sp.]